MAFDLVNTDLLIKRLRVMGFPNDLINLIREWLVGRSFYVQVGEDHSAMFDSDVGMCGFTSITLFTWFKYRGMSLKGTT